jgi:hypothetical protein
MPKNLKLGDLAKQIRDAQTDLDTAKKVETTDMSGTTQTVSATKVKAAVAALKSADAKLARLCQQGVFGVKVSP